MSEEGEWSGPGAEMRVEVLASKRAGAGVHVEVRIVPWAVLSKAELLPAQWLLVWIFRALAVNWSNSIVLSPKVRQQFGFPFVPPGNSH